MGVGCEVGEMLLHVNASSGMSSLLTFSDKHRTLYPDVADGRTTTVPITTLDSYFGDRELTSPALVKLDVQGYEREVLKGAPGVLERATWLVLELSFEPLYDGETSFGDMLEFLGGLGWTMVRPVDFLAHASTGEILQIDALFARSTDSV